MRAIRRPRTRSRNNDAGQVVGLHNGSPFLWDSANGFTDLATLPGSSFSTARGINQSGQIFGTADVFRVWVWANGFLFEPASLGYGEMAVALNDAGLLVGYVQTATGARQAAAWDLNSPGEVRQDPKGQSGRLAMLRRARPSFCRPRWLLRTVTR